MAKTTVTVDLSKQSIKNLRDMIERYRDSLDRRCSQLLERLAEVGVQSASEGFSGAQYDGVNDVSVEFDRISDDEVRVVANGEAVAFIEFGAGITMGGGHPKAGALGFGPGTYPGKGHWNNPKGWTYHGSRGSNGIWVRNDVYRTRGNPPAMAMEHATEEMIQQIISIAEEVFKDW